MNKNYFKFFFKNYFKTSETRLKVFFNRANIADNWTAKELFAAYESSYIAGSKIAVFYHKSMFIYAIRDKLHKTEPPRLLESRFMLEDRALKFPKHHFLLEIFDRKLQQYVEADLINFSNKYHNEARNPKKFEEYKEPFAVLTLSDLEAGFVVFLVPLASSILLFSIEWLPALRNLGVFLIIFKYYFEVKKLEQSKHCELMNIKIFLYRDLKRNSFPQNSKDQHL